MDKQDTILSLNRILANYAIVNTKLFRYKWYAKGEHALLLTIFFSEVQADFHNEMEHLAEYILSIGGKPFATMIKFIKQGTIEEATADDEEEEMISQLEDDFLQIIQQMKELLSKSDEATKHFLYPLQRKLNASLLKCNAYQRK